MKILKIIFWLAPLGVLVWLGWMNLVPLGKMEIVYNFKKQSPFIFPLTPASRVSEIKKDGLGRKCQEILEEPVYFDVRVPRMFKTGEAEIKYKDLQAPVFELGLAQDLAKKNFNFKPIENQILQNLNWNKIQDGETVLYQRTNWGMRQFASIENFLKNLPPNNQIAVYHFDLPLSWKYPTPSAYSRLDFNIPLQGPHRWLTYVDKKEPLSFIFWLKNITEKVKIRVLKDKEEIHTAVFDSDGPARILIPNLPSGVYRLEINGSQNFVISRIETGQSRLVFINHLQLGQLQRETIFITNGFNFWAKTEDYRGAQNLKIHGKNLAVELPFVQYRASSESASGLKQILVPKGLLAIETQGLIAFNYGSYFNPSYRKLEPNLPLDSAGISYIAANYKEPETDGDLKIFKTKFDLSQVRLSNRKLRFALSFPYWTADEPAVKIYEIRLKFESPSMTPGEFWAKTKKYLRMN